VEESGEADGMAVANRRREMGWKDDELVVMYSGNMGLGHRFGEVLEIAREKPAGIRFAFFGRGKRRGEIEAFMAAHPEAAVELHDYAPSEVLGAHLRSADVHLASLAAEWTGTMVPSKLQGIFAAGRPVIFQGDARSSIGRWVEESGGGWVVPPGDAGALARALDEARDATTRATRGAAALAFARANFEQVANARKVAACLAAGRE
jgi:glycosyltransferase involved in cell wall biosynthesis